MPAFNEESIPAFQPILPRQLNYVDCGLFMLEYIENFLSDPSIILKAVFSVQIIFLSFS